MDLTPYVDRLRHDLADAAAAGGEEARAAAERLALALDPATRMVLLEALSQAAAEISGSLEHDAVDVRITGRDPEFVITALEPDPSVDAPVSEPPAADEPDEPDERDDSQTRITLRLPESVKTRAEGAAERLGQSLNAWLVDTVRGALDGGRVDLRFGDSSISVSGGRTEPADRRRTRHVRGWVG